MSEEKTSAVVEARDRLLRQGFTLPAQPNGLPPMIPEDVTNLSDDELMRLFSETSAWMSYAQTSLAMAEIREKEADAALDQIKAIETVRSLDTDSRVTVAAKVGLATPAVIAALEEQVRAYASRKMTASVYANFDRTINLLSREVTRRVNRETYDRRSHKWGGA